MSALRPLRRDLEGHTRPDLRTFRTHRARTITLFNSSPLGILHVFGPAIGTYIIQHWTRPLWFARLPSHGARGVLIMTKSLPRRCLITPVARHGNMADRTLTGPGPPPGPGPGTEPGSQCISTQFFSRFLYLCGLSGCCSSPVSLSPLTLSPVHCSTRIRLHAVQIEP